MTIRSTLPLICLASLMMGQAGCPTETCQDLSDQDTDGTISGVVVTQFDWTDFLSDPVFYESIQPGCDQLLIDLSYSGGCATHRLTLYASDTFADSAPGQADVWLVHADGGDTCESIVPETQVYNLTPLKTTYLAANPGEEVLIVNVRDGDGSVLESFEYDLVSNNALF